MKPFDLKECIVGKKVVTRDGRQYMFYELKGCYLFGRVDKIPTKHTMAGYSCLPEADGHNDLFMPDEIIKIDWAKFQTDTLFDTASGPHYFACVAEGIPRFYTCGRSSKTYSKSESFSICHDPKISDKNDWLPWFGGDCPIPDGVGFEYVVRRGAPGACNGVASIRDWVRSGASDDIIAYRLTGDILDGWVL